MKYKVLFLILFQISCFASCFKYVQDDTLVFIYNNVRMTLEYCHYLNKDWNCSYLQSMFQFDYGSFLIN